MLLTGLHHSTVVSIPLLLPQIPLYSPFISPFSFPPLGAIIIITDISEYTTKQSASDVFLVTRDAEQNETRISDKILETVTINKNN